MDLKHVVVVDDDIDVFNPMDVEWAIATRVQGDRDIMIVRNARAKPLDPSLAPTPVGVVPTGAKVGIDATIPEAFPRERYERITYAYADTAKIDDYLKGKSDPAGQTGDERKVSALADEILAAIDQVAALLHRDRRALLGLQFPAPLPARSVICMRRNGCGRTRAAACARADRSSRQSRRRGERQTSRTSGSLQS